MKGLYIFLLILCTFVFLVILGVLIYNLTSNESGVPSVRFGEPFSIMIGENITVRNSGITFNFLRLVQDSRCPTSVNCVLAGDVRVLVNVYENTNFLETFILIKGEGGDSIRSVEGYSIELVEVRPYPEVSNSIDPSEYVLEVIIDKI